jgi:hypothetical protein
VIQPAGWRGRGRGPRPGDRLPDVQVRRAGASTWLLQALSAPTFHLLLCGPVERWDAAAVADLRKRYEPLLTVHVLAPGEPSRPPDGADLVDESGAALRLLRVRGGACLVVRPDGHIGYRADGPALDGAGGYLGRWLPSAGSGPLRAA